MNDVKQIMDISAIGTSVAAFFNLLPNIAALLSVIWLALRIYESRTVQSWLKPSKIPHTREEDHE